MNKPNPDSYEELHAYYMRVMMNPTAGGRYGRTIEQAADHPKARARFGDAVAAYKAAAKRLGIELHPDGLTPIEENMIMHSAWRS